MFKSQLNIIIFMIIQLINMNIWLRKYPVEVWVTVSPEFPLSPIVRRDERAVRSDGQTDGRDVLRGGSIFLLLMTP
jgi:hypothetical protein